MTLNEPRRTTLRMLVDVLDRVPDGEWVDFGEGDHGPSLRFQGNTQEHTRELRALFPGVLWTKTYDKGCSWWTYDGVFQGVDIYIYAVSEAPPTCRAIEEEVTVEKEVPTAFETVRVVEKRVRWECGGTEEAD